MSLISLSLLLISLLLISFLMLSLFLISHSCISHFRLLQDLDLSGCAAVSVSLDLGPLRFCTALEMLDLTWSTCPPKLSPLLEMTGANGIPSEEGTGAGSSGGGNSRRRVVPVGRAGNRRRTPVGTGGRGGHRASGTVERGEQRLKLFAGALPFGRRWVLSVPIYPLPFPRVAFNLHWSFD